MQLKKMEILSIFYASQVNDEQSSLNSSPKQASNDKMNATAANHKSETNSCQKPEEIRCMKCRSLQVASVQEWPNSMKCQQGKDNLYICSKCFPCKPSVFSVVTDPISASSTGSKVKKSLSKILRTFKVKQNLPGKYCCDKCQFSTKDPLQHKGHTAKHEKFKFVCSHCDCVCYTSVEFQRHLLKHTGIFPYRCKYCYYGAIRNDCVVKHTKRLHEISTGKPGVPAANIEEKKYCLPKQNTEKGRLTQESSDLSLNKVSGVHDLSEIVHSTSDTACNQDTASIQDKNIFELFNFNNYENENKVIEVEIYSPKKGPIMPEMPLTVVAPSTFVVPPNCLAQIIDIKKANSTRQLILKLIPLSDTDSGPETYKEAELGNQCPEQGERTRNGSVSPALDKCGILGNESCKPFQYPGSSNATILNCNLINIPGGQVSCRENAGKENSLTPVMADIFPDKINSLESFQREKCPNHINCTLDPSVCLGSSTSEGKDGVHHGLLDAVQEDSLVPPSSVFPKKCFMLNNGKKEHQSEFRMATKTHSSLFDFSESNEGAHPTKLDDSKAVLGTENGENMKSKKGNVHMEPLEALDIKNEDGSLDGPVISSVFSLNSDAANIPQDIKWDKKLHKKRSMALLCRKIAQLMSAVESNMKSQLAASLRCKNQVYEEKELLSVEPSAKCERNDCTAELEQDSVPSPQRPNDALSNKKKPDMQEQAQPPVIVTQPAIKKTRVANKPHAAAPTFIPQGTVLRVLNCSSTEGPTPNEQEIVPGPSTYCSRTFVPRPVPCCVSGSRGEVQPPRPVENSVNEGSRNLAVPLRDKTRGHPMKRTCHQNGSLPHSKGQELRKLNGSVNIQKTKAKSKNARENLSKKRPKSQEDFFHKVAPVLMRRLRLLPFLKNQLIKCPRRNQPVVVLNHPDVDSLEIMNVMKVINKYKSNVLKAVLSERTIDCLRVKRLHKRLTCQSFDTATQVKTQRVLTKSREQIHNDCEAVSSSPAEETTCNFQCWF